MTLHSERFIVMLKVGCALLAIVALPFFLEVTTGCHYTPPGTAPHPINSYQCLCHCEPGTRHRDLRVLFSEDDVEQQLNSNILLDSPDLDFLNGRFVGLRFRDVGIPPNAEILHARVQFTAAPGSTTGSLTVQIAAEAADNAAPFSMTPGSLGTLYDTASTTAKVDWNPPDWTAGDAKPAQLTEELAPVLQEIVKRPSWAEGNALVLLFKGTAGSALRKAFSLDGGSNAGDNFAAVLSVDYLEASPNQVFLKTLQVCVEPELNGNVMPPGTCGADCDEQLAADCEQRVQDALSGLALVCKYPSNCSCSVGLASDLADSKEWSEKCDANNGVCPPSDVDCNNFQAATSFPGGQPVCTAYSPLGADVFGRRSTCAVEGTAHVTVRDGDDTHTEDSPTAGIVQFIADPCPGESCTAGIEYDLDIQPIKVGNFFHHETFSNLGGIGESTPGNEALILSNGDGTFGQNALAASARGRRGGGDVQGVATTNDEGVDINVGWGQSAPSCSVHGAVVGTGDPEASRCEGGLESGNFCEEDSDCPDDGTCPGGICSCVPVTNGELTLSLDVEGDILNQPPTADAGLRQTLECATAAVTNVVLDASGSTDPDGNIALYSWLRGSLAGPEVGFDEMSKVEQSLGSQTYFLHVIDADGQAGLDTTVVNVVDTTPPVLSCAVVTPVLNQTNHNLVNVGLMADALDQCEGVLPVTVNVFSDEDDEENTGDGKHSPDAKDIAVGSLRLRAERKGNSDGRVYLIIPEATDSSLNRGFSCCTVTVPSSNAKAAQLSAQAQAAAARAFCANAGTPPAGYFMVGDGAVLGPKQ